MNISVTAEAFVPLLKQHKLVVKRESEDKYKLILLSLFKDLLEAEKYVQNCSITTTVYNTTEHTVNDHVQLSKNSRFFPKAIRKYIQDTPCTLTKYTCHIAGRENNIYFYSYASAVEANGVDPNTIKLMFMWLYICIKYTAQNCAKELNVYIFLTPFKKTLPSKNTTIISAEHVNTAFTYCCKPVGEITIFRAEEWFKVFLHESFHAYNLDFGLTEVPSTLKEKMNSIFRIKSDFNLNEAYTETWARLINCALYSFASLPARAQNAETFFVYTDFCLQVERLFSLFQMNKLLNFMGLNYSDIYSSTAYLKQPLYKEDTHVFGYYILTALFLQDYKAFMSWCVGLNTTTNIMKFDCQPASFQKMGTYIQQIYMKPELVRILSVFNTRQLKTPAELRTTTRMAIVDLADI